MAGDWVIDLGHSRIKWARAANDGLLDQAGSSPVDQPGPLETLLLNSPGDRVWASAQSRPETVDWLSALARERGLELTVLATGNVELPVAPAYAGLGSDRWLAMQWPWQQTGSALCVIDCGTALTVDVIDDDGRHRGGWIMAGLATARASLLAKAPGLPRLPAAARAEEHPARDSTQAIVSGTALQLAGAIERAVDAAAAELGTDPAVWITGGDAAAIMPMTRIQATTDEHLVLRGLAMTVNRC